MHNFLVSLMDLCLGWMLHLPTDVQLCILAFGSAVVLTAVRAATSNQDLLRRCQHDKARLKLLVREAKKKGDVEAVQRHRLTLRSVGMKQLRQEARPFMAALVPLILMAVWALERLEFHPLRAGEPIEFVAYFSPAAAGRIAHLVPLDGIVAENGWIQEITPVGGDAMTARWRLVAEARGAPYSLLLRANGKTFEHPLLVGARTYQPPRKNHGRYLTTSEVTMKQVRLFGIVPGIPQLHLPPWLVGYLLIVIPSVLVLKRTLRVY